MELSVDANSNLNLSPLPPPSHPAQQQQSQSPHPVSASPASASPLSIRKRSIQDMDDSRSSNSPDEKMTPPNPHDLENQENLAPLSTTTTTTTAGGDVESTPATATATTAATTTTSTSTVSVLVANTGEQYKHSDADADATGEPGTPAAKKRKLSPGSKEAKQQEKGAKQQEKEAKQQEKEAKERQKQEEKAKREEEKRVKEEEKKKRDAEREEERKRKEEKRKAKEEEKAVKEEEKRKKEAAKEEEKRKKEEEKLKKERAQPKLNAFFAKPTSTHNATSNPIASPKKSVGDGHSLDSTQTAEPVVNDYQRVFPDFFLQSHTTVAPPHRFERDSQALGLMRNKVDGFLKLASEGSKVPLTFRPSELFQMMPYKRRFGRLPASVRDIHSQMQNRDEESGTSESVEKPRSFLRQVKMKSLKFGEDVRPPYQGTYTKSVPGSAARKLMRNPYHRGLPETNYDYDSEAEWEEPEEGEELDSEEEEEGSDDGEDDMEGFLDDDDDHPVDGKRRLIVGDLEPVCTGIQWQEHGVDPSLQVYRMETISDSVTFPIDPFSTAYWHKPKAADPAQPGAAGQSTLHTLKWHVSTSAPTQEGAALATTTPVKAKKGLPAEQLEEFKQVVNGSDLSKLGLVEILKKRFPKVSKDALKDTLTSVATRVGQKEADKKWVCK
ncbi:chromatin assembly factor-I (CAF-I) p90 subunit [Aspergillus melleus]|uniref:Chromatin assembly factor-I (CAF-I) p90 subunit n=1 Tax=Aspergillus melleus TaxID=138277 RepID=A0ACC3ATS6_9EURO|nr:chromatin assembly factor-I (CAF-I) p90 subunit [Aspergillus melleus]